METGSDRRHEHGWSCQCLCSILTPTKAIYTKIFLRFPTTFWPNAQYLIYADPAKRGYYSVWQSLDLADFLPGSHIIFATVTGRESLRIERQSDTDTRKEMMAVLRSMFPDVDVPEPLEMVFKRWHADPLFRGTYSNWGASYAPAVFDDLRMPLEQRLWFAGEATSFKYFGFLQVSTEVRFNLCVCLNSLF